MLEIKVLGGLELIRDGVAATLPPSRKTRALLGYLALTRGPQRREQLCEMFWDLPDDPRGSLRWSLSKIRPLVDEPELPRLRADRARVELCTDAIEVDFFSAERCAGLADPALEDLIDRAAAFRGPLLADLELPDNGGFHTWLLAWREDARQLQLKILRVLIEQLAGTPEEALPYARELVRIDPLDEAAWALVIEVLARTGRTGELRQQYEAGQRALRDVGGGSGPLLRAWRSVQASAVRAAERKSIAPQGPDTGPSIVVLPFTNLSDDPEQQYFADGITGNLIHRPVAHSRHARDLAQHRLHLSRQADRHQTDRPRT